MSNNYTLISLVMTQKSLEHFRSLPFQYNWFRLNGLAQPGWSLPLQIQHCMANTSISYKEFKFTTTPICTASSWIYTPCWIETIEIRAMNATTVNPWRVIFAYFGMLLLLHSKTSRLTKDEVIVDWSVKRIMIILNRQVLAPVWNVSMIDS